MRAFLRRNVLAVEGRFYETVAITEKITETNKFFPRSSGDVTLKWFRSEKTFRHWPSPSRDHWQNWIVLKGKTNHAIWHRNREQLLNGFPERSDVHRAVQSEQRPFEGWIDHRYWFPPGFKNPLPPLHVLWPRLREFPFVVSLLDSVQLLRRSTIEKEKKQPKLPRDYQAAHESEDQTRKKTRNQRRVQGK